MKKRFLKLIILLSVIFILPLSTISINVSAQGQTVYLGGFATAFDIKTKGAYVLALSDVVSNDGIYSPSKEAGIESGDLLIYIDDSEINNAADISKSLCKMQGGFVTAKIVRKGETLTKTIVPRKDLSGNYKIGLFVRDGINGIGTLTFINKDRKFIALGHPVSESDGVTTEIVGGNIFRCSIFGINKGIRGKAGELKGIVINDQSIGELTKNTEQGIVGTMSEKFDLSNLNEIEVGQGKIGKAQMITCVDGVLPQEFEISIIKAELSNKESKNFVIKVTDSKLLDLAGGIVQGMSGSPIIQDGKLIGAVTHVFINDPTRGYGIAVDNMINAISNK